MKTKIFATATLCAALLTTSAVPAFAETTTTTTPAEGRQARLEAAKENAREKACEKVTQRVADQKAKIEEKAAATQARYEKQDARLQTLSDKANEFGVDTSELEGYLDVWQGYTDDIRSMRSDVKANIESGVAHVCAGEREEGKTSFAEARSIVEDINSVKLERRQYWVNTIVPELKSIRDELRELRTSAS